MELISLCLSSPVIPASAKTSQARIALLLEESSGKAETHELISRLDKVTKGQLLQINGIQATKGIFPG